MISFKEYLTEAKKFAVGKDSDYPSVNVKEQPIILIFNEKTGKEYKEVGKTHDSRSHAIKHLIEFDKEFVLQNIKQYVNYLKENNYSMFLYKRGEGVIETDKSKIFAKLISIPEIVLNTFDMINDKIKNKEGSLLEPEKPAVEYIKKIEKVYLQIINEKIKKSVNIDNMSPEQIENTIDKNNIIDYHGFQGNISRTFYLDLINNSVIITSPDYVRTLYKFYKSANNKVGVLKNAMSQKLFPSERNVKLGINNYIN